MADKRVHLLECKADISAALDRYGTTSPAYFEHVRKLSINYWRRLDRTEIFDAAGQRQ